MSKAFLVFSTICFGYYEIEQEELVDANGNQLGDRDDNRGVILRFPGLRPLFAAVKEEFFIRCSIFDVPEPAEIKRRLQAWLDGALERLEEQGERVPLRPDYNAAQIFRWSVDWFNTEPGTGEALNLPITRVDPFEDAPLGDPAAMPEDPAMPADPAAAVVGEDVQAARTAFNELEAKTPYKWLIRLSAPRRMMPEYRPIKSGPNYGHIYHI